jgi:hypothetical protein
MMVKTCFLSLSIVFIIACNGTDTKPKTPLAPSQVTATPGPGYITVTWQDNSNNETGFVIYRDGGAALQTQAASKVGEVSAGITKFLDTTIGLSSDYRYSVVAKNADGESAKTQAAAPAKVTPGVDLAIGTFNYAEGTIGTVMLVYTFFPKEGISTTDVTMKVTGPPGWNNDLVAESQPNEEGLRRGWPLFGRRTAPPLVGEYKLEVDVKGTIYTATTTLSNTNLVLQPPSNFKVTSNTATSVTASWNPVDKAVAYGIALFKVGDSTPIVDYVNIRETTRTFGGLNLEAGEYRVNVVPWSMDVVTFPEKVSPFAGATADATFSIP